MNINKELNSLNQKIVYDLTRFTTVDYEEYLSCIVWFSKCNLRCLYCYNDNIVYAKSAKYSPNDILSFLKTRVGLLDAVVLSGGEATLYDLNSFCEEIKNLGFRIKLDTNGTNLSLIKSLVSKNLLDYMAIDFKAPKYKFKEITGVDKFDEFIDTIKYLIDIDFDFELRTTINSSLLDEKDINSMIDIISKLSYKNIYYLQNFINTSSNIGNIAKAREIDKNKIDSKSLTVKWRN